MAAKEQKYKLKLIILRLQPCVERLSGYRDPCIPVHPVHTKPNLHVERIVEQIRSPVLVHFDLILDLDGYQRARIA